MQDVPYGFCRCGCGQRTAIHKYSMKARGWVKGKPARYILGHCNQYPTTGLPPLERFAAHYVVEDRGFKTPCWVWQGNRSSNGYGNFRVDRGQRVAHRWRWEQDHGPVPSGAQLDHLCGLRACVNPDHLEPVTALENSRRSRACKLTLEQAREIYRRAHNGEVGAQIARDFGVDRKMVYLIRDNGPTGPRDPGQNEKHRKNRYPSASHEARKARRDKAAAR